MSFSERPPNTLPPAPSNSTASKASVSASPLSGSTPKAKNFEPVPLSTISSTTSGKSGQEKAEEGNWKGNGKGEGNKYRKGNRNANGKGLPPRQDSKEGENWKRYTKGGASYESAGSKILSSPTKSALLLPVNENENENENAKGKGKENQGGQSQSQGQKPNRKSNKGKNVKRNPPNKAQNPKNDTTNPSTLVSPPTSTTPPNPPTSMSGTATDKINPDSKMKMGRNENRKENWESAKGKPLNIGMRESKRIRPKKNTENFNPSFEPVDMRIVVESNPDKFQIPITSRDVTIVPNLFSSQEDANIYDRLVSEVQKCPIEEARLLKAWHGDTHWIADDKTKWSTHSPTYDYVCKKLAAYFDMDVKATRFNWYKDTSEWKPFHHDAAAVKPDKAKTQNFTAAVSFGATRDAAFECADSKKVISMPQPNGYIYCFGKDVNIMWKHGILQAPLVEEKGRISVILWGWVDQLNGSEKPTLITSTPTVFDNGKNQHMKSGSKRQIPKGQHQQNQDLNETLAEGKNEKKKKMKNSNNRDKPYLNPNPARLKKANTKAAPKKQIVNEVLQEIVENITTGTMDLKLEDEGAKENVTISTVSTTTSTITAVKGPDTVEKKANTNEVVEKSSTSTSDVNGKDEELKDASENSGKQAQDTQVKEDISSKPKKGFLSFLNIN